MSQLFPNSDTSINLSSGKEAQPCLYEFNYFNWKYQLEDEKK